MKNIILRNTQLALVGFATSCLAWGGGLTFNFEDPKGVNTISFLMDAPLESINGTANGVSGEVTYNPAEPTKISGTIVLQTKTLTVPNSVMEEHIHGEKWMNVAEYPTISFTAKVLKNIQTTDKTVKGDLTGTMTIKDVSQEISVPVTITHLPGKLEARSNGAMKGDLLVLRSNFMFNRSEFNINPGQNLDKVADDVEIRLALAGYAEK